MPKMKLALPSNDRAFHAVVLGYVKTIPGLALFLLAPDKVAKLLVKLQESVELFAQYLDGAKNGDRIQSALKNKTRQEIKAILEKIWHFLMSVADEDDIVVLQQKGFEFVKPRSSSKKKAVVPSNT